MTITEAENAAFELTAIDVNAIALKSEGKLEHMIDLLESLQDLDLDRLDKVLKEGTEDVDL